jgi:16S rRNA processing protein RimM
MRRRGTSPSNPDETKSGSPSSSEPVFLVVGRLVRAHGVNGEIRMEVKTDFPERLRKGRTVYLGEEHWPVKLAGVRAADQALLIRLEGITDREQAALLRGKEVAVQAESLPKLPEGQYYHHQLIGIQVVDESGQELGVLDQILETGANDVYVIKPQEGPELLLPAIADVIQSVDIENRRMTVRPQTWD